VGRDTTVFGSLRAREAITVGRGTEIKGDVTTRNGDVRVGPGVKVWGDISADNVELHENATVDGTIRARGEMRMHTDEVIERPDESAAAMAEMAEELEDDESSTDTDDDAQGETVPTAADDTSGDADNSDADSVEADDKADDRDADDERAEPAE
jgi:hypothetical protein